MDSTMVLVAQSVSAQSLFESLFITLINFLIFSTCVAAVVEVLKDTLGSIVSTETYKKHITADRLRFLTFGIAFYLCWAIDYGILRALLGIGIRAEGKLRTFFVDYAVTAAVCRMGATWFFHRVSTSVKKMQAEKEKAKQSLGTP